MNDFSAQLDKLWNFDKLDESQARFRAELAKYPPDSREALELQTQIARTQGLARKFADADKTLDAILPRLEMQATPVRVKVRYFLERGRTRNSSGERDAAVALFREALKLSERDTLPGADFYRVDALHMLGIAATGDEQLDWNLKALAAASSSQDERAVRWAPIAPQQHRLDLLRAWRSQDGAHALAEGAAVARSLGQRADHPHREVDGRPRAARDRASSTRRRRSSSRSSPRRKRPRRRTATCTKSSPRSLSRRATTLRPGRGPARRTRS